MAERQARIFVPNTEAMDNWVENLLGREIRGLVEQYESDLEWFWFSRYGVLEGGDEGDCDISKLPDNYRLNVGQPKRLHRSIRFRFCVKDEKLATFENALEKALTQQSYLIPGGVRDWNLKDELGNDRHLGNGQRDEVKQKRRACLVVEHYMSTCKLVLDCLIGPDSDNRFCVESNDNNENPHGSTFESLHHLFCNITDVPTTVLIQMGTHWSGLQPTECHIKY